MNTATTLLSRHADVTISRRGAIRRRDVLRAIAVGGAAGALSWTDTMALQAAELRQQGTACIVLWMQGGPSQFETFSPLPGHPNGGETKAIATAVPGIQISENLPHTARVADQLCIIRSMTSREGSHPRATFLMQTGYLPNASVKHPALGAHVAQQLGEPDADLPDFVRVGRARFSTGGGLLGVQYNPFVVPAAGQPPSNVELAGSQRRYQRRLRLLRRVDSAYASTGGRREVDEHRQLYDTTARMVQSPQMKAFQLDGEAPNVREQYGESPFASGCLLARRLVEHGVTFVEVTAGNWDTHQDNFERSRALCEQVDRPYAALLSDLQQRGMLDKTLVVWMGEFGRTPRINPRGGRDHYPRAFNVVLAGGGVQGGQMIGRLDAAGAAVAEQPVTVPDLLRTLCHSLQLDADREHLSSIGRPIKVVDGGQVVPQVFSGA